MESKFTVLLVIKQHTHNGVDNFDRFIRIGMRTYETFLDVGSLHEFIIVTPAAEQERLSNILRSRWPSWPWRFVAEDKLIDKTISSGWGRQQTAKLAVAMLVTTECYLIIDDDTYLTRPFGIKDVKDVEGKVIMNRTLIDFPFFFLWSSQVLKCDFDKVQFEDYHMAITPEIFITSEVRGLIKWLVATYGDNKQWQRYLADHKYTEYCLYWIWLIMQEKHKKLYATSESSSSVYGYAVTSEDHDITVFVPNSFCDNEKHYFSFVQSSIGRPIEDVEKLVLEQLQK
jgi:hypothetical protein